MLKCFSILQVEDGSYIYFVQSRWCSVISSTNCFTFHLALLDWWLYISLGSGLLLPLPFQGSRIPSLLLLHNLGTRKKGSTLCFHGDHQYENSSEEVTKSHTIISMYYMWGKGMGIVVLFWSEPLKLYDTKPLPLKRREQISRVIYFIYS